MKVIQAFEMVMRQKKRVPPGVLRMSALQPQVSAAISERFQVLLSVKIRFITSFCTLYTPYHTAQLAIITRMLLFDCKTKEEILTSLPLKGRTKG